MYERIETEYATAKRKAARQLGLGDHHRVHDLPSNAEIREHIQVLARMHEGDDRASQLRSMRIIGLRCLRLLKRFHPKLIGSVVTGHVRSGSDIDIHAFSDSAAAVVSDLEDAGYACDLERKHVLKHGQLRLFTHIRLSAPGPASQPRAEFPVEITVYSESQKSYVFKSSITGRAMERLTEPQLVSLLQGTYPDIDLASELDPFATQDMASSLSLWADMLAPLEKVMQNPRYHPEGDALYHSLQVFQLACDAKPWDEEFLTAALLHDVGKAIDPHDHAAAAIAALGCTITQRTRFLIKHHMDALHLEDGTLGTRFIARLRRHADFDDLMLLRTLDSAGRQGGVIVPSIDEALAFIQSVAEERYLDDFLQ